MKTLMNLHKIGFSRLIIFFVAIFLIYTHIDLKYYSQPEKVIQADIRSYYAYIPAIVFQNDPKMDFFSNPKYPYKNFFWNNKTETGERIIITTYGMSLLYLPFSLLAHGLAPILGFEKNGFSIPYTTALIFSNLFYLILGLIFYRKLLIKYFDDTIVAVLIFSLVFGTNMFYYSVWESAMPHVYVFALTAVFLYLSDQWHVKATTLNTILLGITGSLIAIIRPNNIFIFIVFALWGVGTFKELGYRIMYFLKKWPFIILIVLMFVIVWIPQMVYWKYITGSWLYFSYGNSGGNFYFDNPQFLNQLFSYRKGAILYSPILLLAFVGLIVLLFQNRRIGFAAFLYSIPSYWVLASWWSWWNGGGFGIRSYIDTYAILFLGLASVLLIVHRQRKYLRFSLYTIIIVLGMFGWFRNYQYSKGIIHFDTNTKEMYWESLFSNEKIKNYWKYVNANRPDYFLARCGVYAIEKQAIDTTTTRGCIIHQLKLLSKDEARKNALKDEAISLKENVFRYYRKKAEQACQ